MSLHAEGDQHRASRRHGESGAVALLVALMIPMLLVFVAVAVDISRWYVELQRMQRAADAAALAAAPYMPESLAAGGPASNAALDVVERNGFLRSEATVNKVAGSATKVSVTISRPVSNFFSPIIGVATTDLSRTGVADFAGPVAMGSPCNLFGREDMEGLVSGAAKYGSSDCITAGEYWVNIAGTNTNKARGDGFSSSWCTKPDTSIGPNSVDRQVRRDQWQRKCPGLNQDWNPVKTSPWPWTTASTPAPEFPGYVFKVRAKASGTLNLEGYDIGWVATGDNCNEGNLVGSTVTNTYVTSTTEATARYKKNGSAFCTGDTQMTGLEGDSSVVKTVVTVRAPSANPYAPLDGTPICTLTLDGWDLSTPASALDSTKTDYDNVLARTHHRWSNLMQGCVNPIVSAGDDYSIQIQTFGGGGQNRFALRAYYGSPGSGSGADVSIFAVDRVSLFNNVTAGTSYFNLVRLDNSARNHVLNVRFYDMGDSNQPVVATVLQPDDAAPVTDTPFLACTGEGPVSGSLTDCTVTATASVNGGRWQVIKIPITNSYTCSDDNDQAKCWVRIRLTTSAGQADTTTWAADLEGDPVRLVQ